jgi:cobalamin-dependent methionine synthase I
MALMEKAAQEMQAVMKPQAVFEIFKLDIHSATNADCRVKPDNDKAVTFGQMSKTLDPEVSFADVTLHSKDLTTNLNGCSKVALLAATIGPQVDALIRKNSSLDPVYASILQATGAMFIEEVVDLVNAEIKKIAGSQGLKTRPRYSPGFGDVPLEVQRDFFRLLPCTRIGLTLMDTLIMAPEKSVTAFVGLGGLVS